MRKTLSVTYEPPPSLPLHCLDGKLTCQVQTPHLSDPRLCREQAQSPSWPGEGQVSANGSRTHTPDATFLYSFLGQAATFFKGTWDFTSNLRSLNIPPATAANEPRCPEGPRIQSPCKAAVRQVVGGIRTQWPAQATEDAYLGTGGFFAGRGLLLSYLSVVGGKGGFGILGKCSPSGLQSWEKARVRQTHIPQGDCGPSRRQNTRRLPAWGRGLQDRREEVWVASVLVKE